jgi:hypothetical protein
MKYLVIFLVLIGFFLNQNSDGIQLIPYTQKLAEEADFIIVGKVIELKEFPTKKETEYVVKVNEMLKPLPSFGKFEGNMTVVAPGVRQYADPSDTRIYPIFFDIGEKALFFLDFIETDPNSALPKGRWEVLPYTFTTKGNCTGEQLLQEMFGTGSSGLIVSQNNKTKPLYTNQLTYLTFNAYNRDLISENKDFEFLVTGPQTKLSQKIPFQLEECKRNTEIKWSFIPAIPGKYTFSGIIGDSEGGSESYSGVLISVAPPLKQIKSVSSAYDIKCRDDFLLVLKLHNESPACVKQETAWKLVARGGWIQT